MSSLSSNAPIYQTRRVRITPTLLEIDRKVYQIRYLDSMSIIPQRPRNQEAKMSIVVGILILLAGSMIKEPGLLLSLGLLVIIISCLWLNALKTTYIFMVTTVSGQEILYKSRRLEEVVEIRNHLESIMADL